MITLAIVLGALLLLLAIAVPVILIGGVGFIFVFGDVIIALGIIALIIRAIIKKARKSKKEL